MERIKTDERLQQVMGAGKGFIYNDYAPATRPDRPRKSARYNTLHLAACVTLQVSLTVAKYFFDHQEEAVSWLTKHRGPEAEAWHRCRCLSRADVAPLGIPRAPARASTRTRPAVVTPGIPREADLGRAKSEAKQLGSSTSWGNHRLVGEVLYELAQKLSQFESDRFSRWEGPDWQRLVAERMDTELRGREPFRDLTVFLNAFDWAWERRLHRDLPTWMHRLVPVAAASQE